MMGAGEREREELLNKTVSLSSDSAVDASVCQGWMGVRRALLQCQGRDVQLTFQLLFFFS